jgi:putative phosphoesterase
MRILVVSDIHANPVALEAISEPFDVCLCLGDIVEYGPTPRPCIDWVRRVNAITVRGNHDHGAAQAVDVQGVSGFRYLTMATRLQTQKQLNHEDRRYLSQLPITRMLKLDGKKYFIAHASPRDPMDEYVLPNANAWKSRIAHLNADFVCVGHTHVQYALQVGTTTVINPGSVGLQRTGDPRCHYAIIEDGKVELKKIEYDVQRIIDQVESADLLPLAKQMLRDVYLQGRYVHPPELPLPIPSHRNGVYKNGVHKTKTE